MSKFCNILVLVILIGQGFTGFAQDSESQFHDTSYSFLEQSDSMNAYTFYKKLTALNSNNSIEKLIKRGKHKFRFDSSYTFRITDELVLETKYEYEIDSINNREISIVSTFNTQTELWEPRSYLVFEYNNKDLLSKSSYNIWDGIYGEWSDEEATLVRQYEYNNDNLLLRSQTQDQEDILNNIIGVEYRHSYDSISHNLLRTSAYQYDMDQDSLLQIKETIYRYNEENLLKEIIDSSYYLNSGWQIPDSTIFNYYANGLLHEEVYYFWAISEKYKPLEKYEYFYKADGRFEEIWYNTLYDFDIMDFVFLEKSYYKYHPTGSLHKIETYEVLSSPPENLIGSKLYRIDETVAYDEIFFPRRYRRNYYENNMIVYSEERKINMWTGQTISAYPIYENFYSPIDMTSTADISEEEISISVLHPNPAHDFVQLSIPNFQGNVQLDIFNLKGQSVFSDKIATGEYISTAQLGAGVYVYSATVGQQSYKGQLVIVD